MPENPRKPVGPPPVEKSRRTPDATGRPARPTVVFAAITSLSLIAAILIILMVFRLEALSAGPHVAFALFLGVAGTIAIGVGLMALVFHSDRAGHDDRVTPLDE
ncbi:MAG: hypothetical protein AAFX08_11335 [Pseudomonadota bacterium]